PVAAPRSCIASSIKGFGNFSGTSSANIFTPSNQSKTNDLTFCVSRFSSQQPTPARRGDKEKDSAQSLKASIASLSDIPFEHPVSDVRNSQKLVHRARDNLRNSE
ncbi:hypothetical protein J6590_091262, partial [Homalodisca vitripennis]